VSGGPSEFSDLVASARVIVEELLEEGVERFDLRETAAEEHPERPTASPAHAHAEPKTPLPESGSRPAPPHKATSPPAPAPVSTPAPVSLPPADWGANPSLAEVEGVLGDCQRCALCQGRTQIVFGDGNPEADLLFVGEGPGQHEDLQGLPFVGKAGQLLTKMIESGLGIPRKSVYICNIVKCRPPNNRDPLPEEVAACRSFLDGQIAAVRPKVIVSLGRPAASLLLGRKVAISRERGRWQSYRGIPLMPTLHPAFVLRQYSEENRRAVWEDLKAAHAKAQAQPPAEGVAED
jgi:uracil-DNA glycosylase